MVMMLLLLLLLLSLFVAVGAFVVSRTTVDATVDIAVALAGVFDIVSRTVEAVTVETVVGS